MPRKGPHIEEEPLTREQEKFATLFRKYRDIYKAAEKAGIAKNAAVRTFHLIQVQEEIERQDDIVRHERARQQVETENLTNAFLDGELIKVIKEEKGSLKKEAIQLGYIVTGRIQAGATKLLEPAGNGIVTNTAPFYQAFIPVGVAAAPIIPAEQEAEVGGQSSEDSSSAESSHSSGPTSVLAQEQPVSEPDNSVDAETIRQRVRKLTNQPAPALAPASSPSRKAGKLQIG